MLAHNIKQLRRKYKLSQEDLSKKAEITYSTLIKIESGVNKNPTLETMKKIAKVLNVKIDDMIKE